MVAPENPATCEADAIRAVLTDRDNRGNLVPQLGLRVLNADGCAKLKRAERLAAAVVCVDGGVTKVGGTLV